ncbi:MAG: glycosyltransferase [Acidimicrobiales bacterium]
MARIVRLANFVAPTSGGLATTLDELGRGYRAAGHDPVLIVPAGRDSARTTPSGTVVALRSPPLAGLPYRALVDRPRVRRLLEALRPDRVEVHDRLTLAWVGSWAWRAGVPAVIVAHERIDGILAGRAPGWFPLGAAADAANRRVLPRFELALCASAYAAAELHRVRHPARVRVVPLGVDLARFRPASPGGRRVPGAGPRLVAVGRLSAEKRPDVAIATLRALVRRGAPAHLVMVGDGPARARLERAAAGLPVRFTGHVDRAAVSRLLAGADVAIAACPVETFGLAALEALASGTAVVAARGGALGVVVPASGPAGRLVDVGVGVDSDAVADGVEALLDEPEPTRRDAARAVAEAHPWSRTLDGFLAAHDFAAHDPAGVEAVA